VSVHYIAYTPVAAPLKRLNVQCSSQALNAG